MDTSDELSELRTRLARLEGLVNDLQRRLPAGAQPGTSHDNAASAPAMPASSLASASPPPGQRPPLPPLPPLMPLPPLAASTEATPPRQELSSTVWIAAFGGVIFLLGAIFALTVSIQRGWISPPVRSGAGLMVGLALGAIAARQILGDGRRLGVSLLIAGLGTFVFALHYGANRAALFPSELGFAGSVLATVFAGGLATRARSGGAMSVAVILATLAPLIFSRNSHNVAGLLAYYLGILAAQAFVYGRTETGARWRLARWLGVIPIAAISAAAMGDAPSGTHLRALLFAILNYAVMLWIIWAPKATERPSSPVSLTASASLLLTTGLFFWWRSMTWPVTAFSIALVVQAVGIVALIVAARRRLGDHTADVGLFLLAAVFLLTAVPVAFDARWLGIVWGAMALASALAARHAQKAHQPDAPAIWLAAFLAAGSASVRWVLVAHHVLPISTPLFVNVDFAGAALTTAAWATLAFHATGGRASTAAIAAELIGINAIAFEWMSRRPLDDWQHLNAPSVAATLTYALAGVVQWYLGLRFAHHRHAIGLRIAGYLWMGIAALKLLFGDLAHSSTEWKAIATLALGGLLMAAALLANRLRHAHAAPRP